MVTSFLRRHNIFFLLSKKIIWTTLKKLGLMFLRLFPSRLKYQQSHIHREKSMVHQVCIIHAGSFICLRCITCLQIQCMEHEYQSGGFLTMAAWAKCHCEEGEGLKGRRELGNSSTLHSFLICKGKAF